MVLLYLHYVLLLLPVGHDVSAWMVREIVDHFASQWGGGGIYGVGDP